MVFVFVTLELFNANYILYIVCLIKGYYILCLLITFVDNVHTLGAESHITWTSLISFKVLLHSLHFIYNFYFIKTLWGCSGLYFLYIQIWTRMFHLTLGISLVFLVGLTGCKVRLLYSRCPLYLYLATCSWLFVVC